MSRLLLWRSEVTNHCHFDFFELHSDPCTSNSIKREESTGVKYDSCTGISNILRNYSQKLTKCFLFNFGDNPNPNRGSRAPLSRPSRHHQWCYAPVFIRIQFSWSAFSLDCSRFVCLCYPGPVIKNTYRGYLNQLWHNIIKNCFCCLASKGKDSCKASIVMCFWSS